MNRSIKQYTFLCITTIFICSLLIPLQTIAANSNGNGNAKQGGYAPDRILVRFKPGTSANAVDKAHGNNKPKKSKGFKSFDGLKLFTLPPGRDLSAAISQYQKNPNVLYAEPDYNISLNATTPNDPYYSDGSLWGLNNTGQNGGTSDADINAPEAWDYSTGSSDVVIAVIDTGVDYNHADLTDNMWVNPGEIAGNNVDDDGNGYIDDVYGIDAISNDGDPMDSQYHGTHVAGTIAGVGNNSTGVAGVSWTAKIIGCKFLTGSGGSTSDAIKCMDYLYDLKTRAQNPVNIVATNNSWGCNGGCSESLAMTDAIEKHRQEGILFIVSAGNDSHDNDSITHFPTNTYKSNVISVAATDRNDSLASFSDYGKYTVHVGAPGVTIRSSTPGNAYGDLNGTSMAAPHVTGLVALLAAEDPTRDWKTLKNLVLSSGTPTASLNGKSVTGRRIRAWDTNGTGAMTCSNQTVQSTIYPISASTSINQLDQLGVAVLNINCATGNGSVSVTTSGGGTSVNDLVLLDNGLGFDQDANDGIYSGYWTAPASAGTYTLTFPDGVTKTVTVGSTAALSSYRQPTLVNETYRTWGGGYVTSFVQGQYIAIPLPFSVKYGDSTSGFSTIYISTTGNISFSAQSIAGLNTELPKSTSTALISAYWDDMIATPGSVRNNVIGSAPNREYAIEWNNVTHNSTGATGKFQVVLFENKSDVLINYNDVIFDNASLNNGASATIGLQVSATRATQYSFNTSSISSGQSYLWKTDSGSPTADAGADQNATGNDTVTLSGSGSDPDGGTLTYSWIQLSGTSATLTNENSATATFTAPNVNETLSFLLTVTDDSGNTATDTISITVSQAANAEGVISFTQANYYFNEGDGSAVVTVSRTSSSVGIVTVDYATITGGSATAASDYTAASGTLTWLDGEVGNKTFSVTLTDDSTREEVETINVQLSNVVNGASIGSSSATIQLADNDSVIGFDRQDWFVNEGDGTVTIFVKRSGNGAGAASIDYASVAGGTATSGTDFTAVSGTLNWADGDTSTLSFSVSIVDDIVKDEGETINLQLSNASGAGISLADTTIRILDNESEVGFDRSDWYVDEGVGTVTIYVKRVGSSNGAVSVDYASIAGGTATSGSDFTAASGTLNWADGEAVTKSFTLSITDDGSVENQESINLQLSNASGATISNADTTVHVFDNESELGFDRTNYFVDEGVGTATIYVKRIGGGSGAVSVNYATVAGGTATDGSDYSAASGTLNWADGDNSTKSFTISITDDAVVELEESISVQLSGASGASITTANTTVRVIDNESDVGFDRSVWFVDESVGNVTIYVKRTGSVSGAVSVNYDTIAGGTTTAGSDYTAASGTLNWAAGDGSTKSFTISITDDVSVESQENILVQLSGASGANISTADTEIRIFDNESNLGFDRSVWYVEESVGTVTIFVKRTGSSSGAVSVNYDTIAGGTTTAGSDYTTASGTLNWADGETSTKSFTVSITDDATVESQENILVQLSGASGANISTADTEIRIFDNESSVGFDRTVWYVNEGIGNVTVYVKRTGSSDGAISVDYATTSGGTTTAGSDYTATSGTLNWADGESTTKSFTVSITDDGTYESLENIVVQLSNPVSANIVEANTDIRIIDNESVLGFDRSIWYATESVGTLTIYVKRTGGSSGAASINYATIAGGTATDGSDFTGTSGTLNWADGETATKSFTISITEDALAESQETIFVQLSGVSGAGTSISDTTIRLIDND